MRIIQITDQDKMELSELGHNAVKSVHEFLECLDKVTDGQISQEMASQLSLLQKKRLRIC